MVRAAPERIVQRIPAGRPGTAHNIARGVPFPISDEADFITGFTLAIDAGRHMH